MPLNDWQFWVVTTITGAIVIAAVRSSIRLFSPKRTKASRKVSLTIDRKSPKA